MPDWTLIIDKDQNRYYMDKTGKIWTSGDPELDYKPVSMEGIDYYLNKGRELIKSHKKSEGLLYLKSILALPDTNNNIYKSQVSASKEINEMIKIEGTRFSKLNEDASLLLYRDNKYYFLINDLMYYSVKSVSAFKILSKKVRESTNYYYYGILLGFRFNEDIKDSKNGYTEWDLLIAIDCERFMNDVRNAKTVETHWRKRLGSDTFERNIVLSDNSKIIYEYKDILPYNYNGYEAFYSKKNYCYYFKSITSKEKFNRYKTSIFDLVKDFKIN